MLSRERVQGNLTTLEKPQSNAAGSLDTAGTVASSLASLRRSLLDEGEKLVGLVEGPARMLVEDALAVLKSQVCRIAVIGQVKAGKSSFVNLLVRRPDLLPTHVNPWTTAITNLHFGESSGQPDVAAQFSFFEKDEWQRLGAGGGRLRELTEHLVPGFEPDLLVRNLKSMRVRAEKRHGSNLNKLLGATHSFAEFSPSLLDCYVCAGNEGPFPVASEETGKYADIVKSADIYLPSGPFDFPTTVIDTPGTNDPFLIRDEISRRSLESADVYIVVLTAVQVLSKSDIALLRILRGLHKDRIIVFINRIDQLAQLPEDVATVKLHVRNGLRREFPGMDIPILTGSALWGNQGLAFGKLDAATALTSAFAAFARQHPSPVVRETVANAGRSGPLPAEVGRALVACSGMPELTSTLSQIINQSHPAHVLNHVAASFAELAEFGELASGHELRRAEQNIADVETKTGASGAEASRLQDELQHLTRLTHALGTTFHDLENALQKILQAETRPFADALRNVVERFSESECVRLAAAIHGGEDLRAWKTDTSILRGHLEQEFTNQFHVIEGKILAAEAEILPNLKKIIAQVLPDALKSHRLDLHPAPMPFPSIAALGRVAVFDLGKPWWKAWWSAPLSMHDRVKQLDQAIRQEFEKVADDLVTSARVGLTGQLTKTIKVAESICMNVIDVLQRQCEWNMARTQELMLVTGANGESREHLETSRSRLAEVSARQSEWAAINTQLAGLRRRSKQLVE
jgi:Dynamin family